MSLKNTPSDPFSFLLKETDKSPILLVGETVERRRRFFEREGKERGQIVRVMVKGNKGRVAECVGFDWTTAPKPGEKVIIPIWIARDGQLRVCQSDLFEDF